MMEEQNIIISRREFYITNYDEREMQQNRM